MKFTLFFLITLFAFAFASPAATTTAAAASASSAKASSSGKLTGPADHNHGEHVADFRKPCVCPTPNCPSFLSTKFVSQVERWMRVLRTSMPMQEHCCLGLLPGDQRRLQEAKEERKYRLLLEDVQS
ncbi:hypothetical protein H2203_005163 [Taxawa tesnikishii (nom. ined.)]|nr:hypothetical protein H2203_005163 [Dothideales sp. JES 119]